MKREVEIIDRLSLPKTAPDPIKLVACLQNDTVEVKTSMEKCYYFYPSDYIPSFARAKRIERLAHIESIGYDLIMIIAETDYNGDTQNFYLGFWNDGVMP